MASQNVKVVVRCRPMSASELSRRSRGCESVIQVDAAASSIEVAAERDDGREHKWTFDHVYAPGAPQPAVYGDTGGPLVAKAMDGFNGTMFAYGQTGSGKTFTMMGVPADDELRGIIPRLVEDLFARVAEVVAATGGGLGEAAEEAAGAGTRFLVTVSYLEIYNEVLHDLLNPQETDVMRIREHPDLGIYVEPLCELSVARPDDIYRLLDQGNKVRRVASTQMNARSSRSHSVFTVKLQRKTRVEEDGVERETALGARLNLVDLAGSERASKTGAAGATLKEGAAINQSLMALGAVINALSEGAAHVPYRNSKLTRLLQESLGGNAATVMVANCSPADYNADETTGTLRYASRAKRIENKVSRNEDVHEKVIRELQEEIERLRAMVGDGPAPRGLTRAEAEELEASRVRERELQARVAAVERQKDDGWSERARLTAALEEERKNNMNRAVKDLMSSVKEDKLRLLAEVRELTGARKQQLKAQAAAKAAYTEARRVLESAMAAYEAAQDAYDALAEDDPRHDESGAQLLADLDGVEAQRGRTMQLRAAVGDAKRALHDLDTRLTATKAELAAASSTIAENDRLRAAIQEEERQAFQQQKDQYLQEQLAEERHRMARQASDLDHRLSLAAEGAETTRNALEAAARERDLLAQELEIERRERHHLQASVEHLEADLEAKEALQREHDELEVAKHDLEYEAEQTRERADALQDEVWRLQHAGDGDRTRLSMTTGAASVDDLARRAASAAGVQAKLAEALNARRGLDADLRAARVALEAERAAGAKLAQAAKDREFAVSDRAETIAGRLRRVGFHAGLQAGHGRRQPGPRGPWRRDRPPQAAPPGCYRRHRRPARAERGLQGGTRHATDSHGRRRVT